VWVLGGGSYCIAWVYVYRDVRDGHFFFFHLIPNICRGVGRWEYSVMLGDRSMVWVYVCGDMRSGWC